MKKILLFLLFLSLLPVSCGTKEKSYMERMMEGFVYRTDGFFKYTSKYGYSDYFMYKKNDDMIIYFLKEHKGTDEEAIKLLTQRKNIRVFSVDRKSRIKNIYMKNPVTRTGNYLNLNPDGSFRETVFYKIKDGKIVDKINYDYTVCHLFTKDGRKLFDIDFQKIINLKNNLFITVSKNVYSIRDLNGKVFLDGYEFIGKFKNGFARVKKDDKWGFVDKGFNSVIPCRYDYVENFKDGAAAVRTKDTWKLVDKKEKQISNKTFVDMGSYYKKAFVPVKTKKEGPWEFYNFSSSRFSGFKADKYIFFNNSNYFVLSGKKSVVVDQYGKPVHPGYFDHISPVNKSRFIVTEKYRKGVIDNKGRVIIPLAFSRINSNVPWDIKFTSPWVRNEAGSNINLYHHGLLRKFFYEGVENYKNSQNLKVKFFARTNEGKMGVFDNNGKLIVPFKCISIYQFDNEFIRVAVRNGNTLNHRLLNIKTKKAVYQSNKILKLSKNYFRILNPVKRIKDNYTGLIDRNGKLILEPVYRQIVKGSGNQMIIWDGIKFGIYDPDMKKVLEKGYDGILYINGSYVMQKGKNSCIINKNGKYIIENIKLIDVLNDDLFISYTGTYDLNNIKQGIVDKSGSAIIPTAYDSIFKKGSYILATQNLY